jgi:cobalt-zinc-cadmium efflux system outer membrane protein
MRDVSRRVWLYAASAVLVSWTSVHAQNLTEAEAVARALAASPRVRAAAAAPAQAAADYGVRRLVPNPAVRFQQEDAAGTRDRFLLVEQELPLAGRRGLLAQASTQAVASATAQARVEADLVRRDVRIAYTDLLAFSARERALGEGLAALDAVVERLRTREQAGEGSAFDRMRAERERVDFADDRRAARAGIRSAQAQLAGLLAEPGGGASLTASDDIGRPAVLPSLPEAVQQAIGRRPALRAAAADIERLRFERQAAGRLARPQPVVSGGWKPTAQGGRSESGYAFGVGVAVPLFARGSAEAAVSSAALTAAEARRAALALEIEADVRAAHARAEVARERVQAYETDALARSRELVRIATLAYDEGELGILELLDAHRTRLDAELRALSLKTDERLAAVLLDFATAEEVMR